MKLKDYIAYALNKDEGWNSETIIIIDDDKKYKVIIRDGDYYYADFIPDDVLMKDICRPIITPSRTTITTKTN